MNARQQLFVERRTSARHLAMSSAQINDPSRFKRVRRELVSKSVRLPARAVINRNGPPAGADPAPSHHHAAIALAEREVRELTEQISQAESRVGVLQQQRKNLLNWLLRNAAPPADAGVPKAVTS